MSERRAWHGLAMASLSICLMASTGALADSLEHGAAIPKQDLPSAQNEWRLEKQSSGITIQSRAVEGSSAREVRATTDLQAGVVAVTRFLQDPDTNPRWVPGSQSVSIFERPSPQVSLVHFVMSASWPFQPRDAVARFELKQTPASVVWIRFDSQPKRLPLVSGTVRLETYSGCWRLTPIASGQTHLDYRSHIEPGGLVPAWAANSVAIRSTFKAMKNLRRQVPDYVPSADLPLSFLRDATVFSAAVPEIGDGDCDHVFTGG